jgi:hypothetical protein
VELVVVGTVQPDQPVQQDLLVLQEPQEPQEHLGLLEPAEHPVRQELVDHQEPLELTEHQEHRV